MDNWAQIIRTELYFPTAQTSSVTNLHLLTLYLSRHTVYLFTTQKCNVSLCADGHLTDSQLSQNLSSARLFTCGLFNNAASSSDYEISNEIQI